MNTAEAMPATLTEDLNKYGVDTNEGQIWVSAVSYEQAEEVAQLYGYTGVTAVDVSYGAGWKGVPVRHSREIKVGDILKRNNDFPCIVIVDITGDYAIGEGGERFPPFATCDNSGEWVKGPDNRFYYL